MSHTHPEEAHHVKKGQYVMLKGKPCKIMDVKTSKTGKHGHAKCNITGIDVLDGRKYNEVHPGHIIVAAFDLRKDEYEVADIEEDGTLKAMDADGNEVVFQLEPESEEAWGPVHKDLMEKYKVNAAKGDSEVFYVISVSTAPIGETDPQLKSVILEFKEGKE